MFYFTVEELLENVNNKENYNISLYNRENNIVTISDSDSTIDYIDFFYDDRIFPSRKDNIKSASETFEKEFHNYIERHKKDFSLAFQKGHFLCIPGPHPDQNQLFQFPGTGCPKLQHQQSLPPNCFRQSLTEHSLIQSLQSQKRSSHQSGETFHQSFF